MTLPRPVQKRKTKGPEPGEPFEAMLKVYSPVYDLNSQRWRFWYGKEHVYMDVSESNIRAFVLEHGGALIEDWFRVMLQIEENEEDDGKKVHTYKVLDVLDFIPAFRQGRCWLVNTNLKKAREMRKVAPIRDRKMRRFEALLREMVVKGSPPDRRKSSRTASADCSDTQTPSRTSEGVSGKRERESPGSTASTAPKTPRSRNMAIAVNILARSMVNCLMLETGLGKPIVGLQFVSVNGAACHNVFFDDWLKRFHANIRDNARHHVAAAFQHPEHHGLVRSATTSLPASRAPADVGFNRLQCRHPARPAATHHPREPCTYGFRAPCAKPVL